jgi:hypothetical protein
MSKMDALRAMREARYAQAAARAGTRPTVKAPRRPASTGATATASSAEPPAEPPAVPPAEPETPLCGHRNLSGRTCTREQGHAAKNHRYS